MRRPCIAMAEITPASSKATDAGIQQKASELDTTGRPHARQGRNVGRQLGVLPLAHESRRWLSTGGSSVTALLEVSDRTR